jgi:salicylate hydroxylase
VRVRSIAVAGGGIAGLASAALLAREGAHVVVHDRMDAPSPIGSGLILQPVGLAVLDEIGVGDRLRALGAPIRRLFGRVQPSGRVVLDVRYRALGGGAGEGVAVHRGALFEALLDAAQHAGVVFENACEIAGARDGRLVLRDGRTTAKFDLVVDALGVKSPLSRDRVLPPLPFGALWGNLDWPVGSDGAAFDGMALEQRYEAARKMVGVLPIGSVRTGAPRQAAFFWSLRHADLAAWQAGGLSRWKDDVLRLWPQTAPFLEQIREREQLIFASYCHGTLRSPLKDGIVHIGDSWHSASPQLGQGANMALLDALALSQAMAAHADLGAAMEAYARARLGHIRIYQLASWMFTPAYQSNGTAVAWVRDWLMSPLSRVWPVPKILAALVAGTIGAPLAAIEALKDG